jgi:hypothetical protein
LVFWNLILYPFHKVAAMGLDPAKHLGKELAFLNAYLHKLKEYVKYVQSSFSLCVYINSLKYVD